MKDDLTPYLGDYLARQPYGDYSRREVSALQLSPINPCYVKTQYLDFLALFGQKTSGSHT